jgi:hypothetical protein
MIAATACSPCTALSFRVDTWRHPFLGKCLPNLPFWVSFEALFSHKLENLETVQCVALVSKRLPGCEHRGTMACSRDPAEFECKEVCGGTTTCCGRTCKSRCHECQEVTRDAAIPGANALPPVRTHHESHPCERTIKCQHFCGLPCSSEHSCNPKCPKPCRQRCGHQKCKKQCWDPCPPCMEPCEWRCDHHSCPVVCGSVSFHGRVALLETNS